MSYAIIADSGKQFRVEAGQSFHVDLRDAQAGDKITFEKVLLVSDDRGTRVGHPLVAGASVKAEVVAHEAGPKLVVQKFRRRKNSRRRTGHRQFYTKVRIESIDA